MVVELTGDPEPLLDIFDPGRRGGTRVDNGASSSVEEGCSSSSVSVATGAAVLGLDFAALKDEGVGWVMTLVDWERARATAGVGPGTASESAVPARRIPVALLMTEPEPSNK